MLWSSILLSGTLKSVTDLELFGGANTLAIESRAGQLGDGSVAGVAELIAPGRYRLTRLLRGQRGTEAAMGNPTPAGARVAMLDSDLAPLRIASTDLGICLELAHRPGIGRLSDASFLRGGLHAEVAASCPLRRSTSRSRGARHAARAI